MNGLGTRLTTSMPKKRSLRGVYTKEKQLCNKLGLKRGEGIYSKEAYFWKLIVCFVPTPSIFTQMFLKSCVHNYVNLDTQYIRYRIAILCSEYLTKKSPQQQKSCQGRYLFQVQQRSMVWRLEIMRLQSRLFHVGSAATAREAAITCVSSRACKLEAESVSMNVSTNYLVVYVQQHRFPFHPWPMPSKHLTILSQRGVGALLSVFTFNHQRECHVYSNSMPLKQMVGRPLTYNGATSYFEVKA